MHSFFKTIFKVMLLVIALGVTGCKLTQKNMAVNNQTIAAYFPSKPLNSKYLVVFEAGLGDSHDVWIKNDLLVRLGLFSDYVIYDRQGYGKSSLGIDARDIERLTSDLTAVADEFRSGRKLILVGHSLGGMVIRDYAIKNPDTVASLLFIDSSHEDYNNPSEEQVKQIAEMLKSIPGAQAEALSLGEDSKYMKNLPVLPNVPVIVLDSMKVDDSHSQQDRNSWYEAKEKLKAGVTRFEHITTTQSGHYIMLDQPNLVLNALEKLYKF